MLFENLKVEMCKKKLTMKDFCDIPNLNLTYQSVRNKFEGITEWKLDEMIVIRDAYFPGLDIETLFKK